MIEGTPGQHITSFAAQLVRAAEASGEARGVFNGVEIIAERGATADGLRDQWQRKTDAAHVAYLNSPTSRAAKAKREAGIAAAQETHDNLVRDLATLDFENDVAVIDWICAIQDSTDHVSLVVDKPRIIAAFEAAGFAVNVNCGPAFKADDRDNVFRYLVGQALDGLKSVAIHGIIHKFAGEWKDKFVRTPQQQAT